MISFFETIFTKITSIAASAIIAVGLVSAPIPQSKLPPPVNSVVVEVKQDAQEVEKIKLETELKQAKADTLKAKIETEKTKKELEKARAKAEQERLNEIQRLADQSKKEDQEALSASLVNVVIPNTTLCNGVSYSPCPTGQTFSCPASGEAKCLLPELTLAEEEGKWFAYADEKGWSGTFVTYKGERRDYVKMNGTWMRKPIESAVVEQYVPPASNAAAIDAANKLKTLMDEHQTKQNALATQILEIKKQYYQDIEKETALINSNPWISEGSRVRQIESKTNELINAVNSKVNQLNLDLESLRIEYLNKVITLRSSFGL